MNPSSEPVAWSGAVTALAVAAIPFLRSMGVHITQDQANSGLGLLAALIVVLTLFVRSKVTPSATAVPRKAAEEAISTAMVSTPGVDPRPTV